MAGRIHSSLLLIVSMIDSETQYHLVDFVITGNRIVGTNLARGDVKDKVKGDKTILWASALSRGLYLASRRKPIMRTLIASIWRTQYLLHATYFLCFGIKRNCNHPVWKPFEVQYILSDGNPGIYFIFRERVVCWLYNLIRRLLTRTISIQVGELVAWSMQF